MCTSVFSRMTENNHFNDIIAANGQIPFVLCNDNTTLFPNKHDVI